MQNFFKKNQIEIFTSLICLTLGMASGFFVGSPNSNWYVNLIKPSFTPPNWLFGPVWTILYISMGIALGRLWRNKKDNIKSLILFAIQLCLNLAWTPIFFYFHNLILALIDIIILWIMILILMISSRKDSIIVLLLAPYIAWVSLALTLTFSIFQLNYFL